MSALDMLLDDDDLRARHGSMTGVMIAKVTSVTDPEKLGRVKVLIPSLSDEAEILWARVLRPAAGAAHGLHLPHEIDDEVLITFIDGHPELPIVLGGLWSAKQPPLVEEGMRQDHRQLTSRSGHIIRLDDTENAEKIEIIDAKGESSLTFDTASGELTIAAKNKVTLKAGTHITLACPDGEVIIDCKTLSITAADGATLGGGAIALESNDTVTINGPSVVTINVGALEVM
jgi:uncharacterized protein involved in type VI secretion and phage assembly